MLEKSSKNAIAASLLLAVFLWGGSNTGAKFLVAFWPPLWVGCTRFLCAGLLMMALLRWTDWLGRPSPPSSADKHRLWWRTGLSLAVYIVVFNVALSLTAASHVVLYLGASPVWALLAEGRPDKSWRSLQRYGSAFMALAGVFLLFWPALRQTSGHWLGELLGLICSILWTYHGRQCRRLAKNLSGVTITAHTMWRAGALLIPLAMVEAAMRPPRWGSLEVLVQAYCILFGGVAAYALWNNALRHWTTSQVYLFNNLIPLSTMGWAYFCLGEKVTATFFMAMALIVSAVILAQADWQKIWDARWWAPD